MDDLGEKNPNFPYCLTHVSALVAVVTKRIFVNIFGEKSSKEPEILKLLEFLTGYEIKFVYLFIYYLFVVCLSVCLLIHIFTYLFVTI